MRIFVAGASGVIGSRVVPLLAARGDVVAGMTRSSQKATMLRDLGAEPVVCDVYDADGLAAAVAAFKPELVMHQLTDLPDDMKRLALYVKRNNRIRTEGTQNLLDAAKQAGVRRFLAQSIAWEPPAGGEAVKAHERMVLDFGGVVLRYGQLYGPGTYHEQDLPESPRVHVSDAARRTVELMEAGSGVVVVTE